MIGDVLGLSGMPPGEPPTTRLPVTAAGCGGPSTARSAAPRSCAPASLPSTSTARRQRRTGRRSGRGQPHRPLPLLPRQGRPAPGHRRQIVDQVIARSCRTSTWMPIRRRATSSPRRIGTIIGWFADHPNSTCSCATAQRAGAGRRRDRRWPIRSRVAAGADGVFGLEGDRRSPAPMGWSGSSSPSCAWWLARRDQPGALSRERFTRRSAGDLAHARGRRPRERRRHRLGRAAAVRRAHGGAVTESPRRRLRRPGRAAGRRRAPSPSMVTSPAISIRSPARTAGTGGSRRAARSPRWSAGGARKVVLRTPHGRSRRRSPMSIRGDARGCRDSAPHPSRCYGYA